METTSANGDATKSSHTEGSPNGAFLRAASGVYRVWSPTDGFIYNVIAINSVMFLTFVIYTATTLFSGGSLVWAIVICGAFCLFEGIAYAILIAVMPRSGGDYVFQTRILGGFSGTFFAFTAIVLTQAVMAGLIVFTAVHTVLAPFFTMLGSRWDAQWAIDFAGWMATKNGYFVVGAICLLWAFAVNVWGMRIYALLQRWFFAIGIALLLVVLGILGASSHDDFVSKFNEYMLQNQNVNDAYAQVIATAQAAGNTTIEGISFGATMAMIPVITLSLMFLQWGVAQGGEIKSGRSLKAQIYQMPGAVVASTVMAVLLAALLLSRVGGEFITATGYLFMLAPDQYSLPFAPLYGTFVALLADNGFLIVLVALFFQAWFWMMLPNAMMAGSRVLLAMAIDRELPAWFAAVNRRTVTPIHAIATLFVLGMIFVALVSYTSFSSYLLSIIVPSIICFGVTCLAAAIMPWRRPQLHNDSPAAHWKILGVPIVTVAGSVFFAFAVWVAYQMFSDDRYGVNGRTPLLLVAGLYVLSIVIYTGSRVVAKAKAVEIDKAYAQIPIE